MSPLKFSSANNRNMRPPLRLASLQKASADFTQVALLAFNTLSNFLGLLLSTGEVALHIGAATQVIGNDSVNVSQGQGGVAMNDRLRSCAILK
jgi:hypothetical protein